MITVYQLNPLTESERAHLNGPNGGWDSSPRFSRYLNVTAMGELDAIREAWQLGEYSHVADVQTDDLDDAYAATQNVERSWVLNRGVEARTRCARSTSVGDIFEDRLGRLFVVQPIGFTELGA